MFFLTVLALLFSLQLDTCESRVILPNLPDHIWRVHNENVKTLLNPVHYELSSGIISPSEAAQKFSKPVHNYLMEESDFSDGASGSGGRRKKKDVDVSDEPLQLANVLSLAESGNQQRLRPSAGISPMSGIAPGTLSPFPLLRRPPAGSLPFLSQSPPSTWLQ
jgi:hypothetical protein